MHWRLPLFLLLWSQGASSKATARGMDEGPWSSMMMDPQPEVLIVKDKGSPAPAPAPAKDSGMSMKDLTPLLCLLAPLLLAAIMIPAKMSMMMNMMNGGGMMMMPGSMLPQGMLPGGMLPGGMLPGGMLPGGMFPGGMPPGGMLPGGMFPGRIIPGERFSPLKMLLMGGGDGSSQLPVTFKAGSMSKEFGGELKMANSSVPANDTTSDVWGGNGSETQEGCKSKLCRELKKLAKKTKGGKKGDEGEEMSRVWSKRTNGHESIAQQIIGLVDHIERVLSGEESD